MSLLEFRNVSYSNDNKSILKDLTVRIDSGDFISIVGPSGSGKSTFLKLCCNLISPSHGNIFFKERPITELSPMELRKNISYCFQTPYLFNDTVLDNIEFPYSIRNMEVDNEKVLDLLTLFNLDKEYIKKEVKNLSGGEKQRIALIRTLLFPPEILLLDEITSALDNNNTLIVENVIKSLNDKDITILWVTHNQEQSKKYANKVITLENGEIQSLEVIK
jgi:putative ABC transport system ATP-binding protein